jgi:hypothetical protein
MAALTLAESAKLETGNVVKQTITELYAGSSDILSTLPFDDITGGSLSYLSEEAYPGVGFRGVNEKYDPTVGILNPKTEVLTIAGGDLDVDKFIIKTRGMRQRAVQESLKVRALGLAWTEKFIKGDNLTEKREFDGLQTRLIGNQKMQAGTTANGTALSLSMLDEAIRRTLFPTHLLMSSKMAIKFGAAARDTSVGGYITYDKNELGAQIMSYNGLPILTVDLNGSGDEILPFTEAATSGTATGSSIYVLSIGDSGVMGIQNGGLEITDLGELQDAPVFRTRVEWYSGFGVFNGRAATRLWSIANAPITA